MAKDLEAKAAEWITKWPHYCRTCEAAGALYWTEHHDFGYPGEPMQDICDECIGQDKCPRCGQRTFILNDDDECPEICSACGWDVNKPDTLPPVEENLDWIKEDAP